MKGHDEKITVHLNGQQMILDLADFPHGQLVDRRKDDEYDIEFYSVPESTRVPSYDPATGGIVWMPVKCWSVHRGKKLEFVELEDGSQIFTDDDPRAVYGIASDAGTLEPQRFRPSEALSRGVMVPVTTDSLAIDLSKTSFYDFDTGLASGERGCRSVPVDFDFGQFVGIMAGDGWSDIERRVYLSDNEGYNAAAVSQFMSRVYDGFSMPSQAYKASDLPGRYGDTVKYYLSAQTLSLGDRIKELVDGHGDDGTSGSANKRLPLWYQFAGREFILGLVNGLVATDGTVSVSHGKEKPQLQIQFSTTSLRLAREFQRCCRLLGVGCHVGSGRKDTTGGNHEWLCIVSTVDAKRIGLLDRCCHGRKREVFSSTEVSDAPRQARNDLIPFPKSASAELIGLIPSYGSPADDFERRVQSLCINVRRRAAEGVITRFLVQQALKIAAEIADRNSAAVESASSALVAVMAAIDSATGFRSRRETHVSVDSTVADVLRRGVKACQTRTGDKKVAGRQLSMLYNVRTKGYMTSSQASGLAEFFACTRPNSELRDSMALSSMEMIAESAVRWERVVAVEKTGVEEVGYDLTVPGYDTFVNADGVVLSNTMNFHVPASEKAVRQAIDKMLPSSNLFSTTDLRSPRYVPMMEMTMGLAKLTAKPSGRMPRVFRTKSEAIQAYRRGEFAANDPVIVGDM